jgi:hypothetical protein
MLLHRPGERQRVRPFDRRHLARPLGKEREEGDGGDAAPLGHVRDLLRLHPPEPHPGGLARELRHHGIHLLAGLTPGGPEVDGGLFAGVV